MFCSLAYLRTLNYERVTKAQAEEEFNNFTVATSTKAKRGVIELFASGDSCYEESIKIDNKDLIILNNYSYYLTF